MAKGTFSLTFTRYLWVWLAGAVLGAGAGAVCCAYELNTAPRYTAKIPFQILPPPFQFGQSDTAGMSVLNPDDTSALITRQQLIFEQEMFLHRILQSDEFHPAGKPNAETPWLTEHKSDPVYYLKRDLKITPHVNAAAFDLTFESRDALEAQRIVQTVAKEYMELLRNQSLSRRNGVLNSLSEGVRRAEDDFKLQSQALADYGRQMQIDVLKTGFQIQVDMLKHLNDEFTRADTEAASAEAQLDTFVKRRDALRQANTGTPIPSGPGTRAQPLSGTLALPTGAREISTSSVPNPATPGDLEIAGVLLPLEMKQVIGNDATLRTLVLARFQAEQDLAAENSKANSDASRAKELSARLQTISDQLQQWYAKLALQSLELLEKTLQDDAASKRAQAAYVGQIRKRKEDEVNLIGQRMLQWDQRSADLKEQQDSLNRLKAQFRLVLANAYIDDTRVQQMITAVTVPDTPSWPTWPAFIWPGAAAGFAIGGLLALRLASVRARRGQPRISAPLPAANAFPVTSGIEPQSLPD